MTGRVTRRTFERQDVLLIAALAIALAGPADNPPPPVPTVGGGPPPTGSTGGIGGVVAIAEFDGPPTLRVGQVADFYSPGAPDVPVLCYQVGTSRVGCAKSSTGWWHLTVKRGGPTRYVTLRVDGKIVARLVYRNVE